MSFNGVVTHTENGIKNSKHYLFVFRINQNETSENGMDFL